MPIPKLMGTETEYNIYSDGANPSADDAVNLMINILKGEPLGLDKRAATPTRCFLANGGLIYKDVGAPEYCTPECHSPRDLVVFDKAGELIVQELARKVSVLSSCNITIYKKSSDGFGHTSGCHENYSISPDLFKTLVSNPLNDPTVLLWTTFLAIRQVLIGGGKIGSEFEDMPCRFQMSQRADFIVAFRNNQTLSDRPIIQTRDEALANGDLVKRLHVICGDANLCEPAVFLKGGLTSLMLMALEDGYFGNRDMPVLIGDIPHIFRRISRDTDLTEEYETTVIGPGSRNLKISLLMILEEYLHALRDYYFDAAMDKFDSSVESEDYKKVLVTALDALGKLLSKKYRSLFGICDWVTKLILAEKFLSKRSASFGELAPNPELQAELVSYVDMGYANTNKDSSVYAALAKRGLVGKIVLEPEIIRATMAPPPRGRALQRVKILEKFPDNVQYVDWNRIVLVQSNQEFSIEFATPFGYNGEVFDKIIGSSGTPEEFFRAWKKLTE